MSMVVPPPSTTYLLTNPVITSPVSGATVTGTSVTVVSSALDYSPNDGTVNLASTSWYLYSDSALQNLVASDLNDTVNLTSYTFNNLTGGQTYYATVQYTTDTTIDNDPATSAAVSFTMAMAVPVAPVVSFDGRFSTLPLLTTVTGNERVTVLKNNQNLTILTSSMGASGSETGPSLHLAGNPYIYVTGTSIYTITDYKLNETYTVAVSAGSVTIAGDLVTVTAPNQSGPIVLTVNNKPYTLTVLSIPVSTPSINSPVNASINQPLSVTFTSSAFFTPVAGPVQTSASWELATDAAFTTIFSQSLNSTTNLTSWMVNGLAIGTVYYVRVQYKDNAGTVSAWSAPYSITTKNTAIASAITANFTSGAANSQFGYSITLSSDGTIALIGASYENTFTGATYIYQNVSGTWTQIARVTSGVAYSYFGWSVSLSLDGTIALIGAYSENSYTGAAYIYQNVAGTWTKIARVTSGVTNSYFGYTVALSSDGTIALIGAITENSNTGAAYLYQNVAGTWTQIARVTSGVASSNFGFCVVINSDGTIALIGAYSENSNTGAAYIYQNVSGTWTKIARVTSGVANSRFGMSVSLSSDGTIALIGAFYENSYTGAAYIYQNVAGTWTQITRLVGSAAGSQFGYSVSLSSDGTIAAIGAYGENSYTGAAYIYQKVSGTWTQISRLINGVAGSYFGASTALNSAGSVAAIGATSALSGAGAVYIAT